MNAIAKKCLNAILQKKISPLGIGLSDQDDTNQEEFDCLGRLKGFMSEIRKKLPF